MKNRLLALAMVLGVGLLVTAAIVVGTVVSLITSRLGLGGPLPLLSRLALMGLLALAFALAFKLLPNARIAWPDVWVGAAVTALLVSIGIYVVQVYLSAIRFRSALDAAGSAAVFLMGFFFFGQILVFGAVFTRVYAAMFGSNILPGRRRGERTDP